MTPPQKICPKCEAVAPLAAPVCRNCGHGFRTQFAPPLDQTQEVPMVPPVATATPVRSAVAPRDNNRSRWKHIFWVAPVMLLGFWNMANRPSTDAVPTLEAIKLPISAARLDADYQSNVFNADAQYKGKLITIEGPVKEIGKSNDGYPLVTLFGSDEDRTILCVFDQGSENALVHLSVSGRAQIIGQCRGKVDDEVIMGGCILPKQETRSIVPADPQGMQKAMNGME